MKHHHSQRRIGAAIVIGLQVCIGSIGLRYFFGHYDSITKNKSTVEAYETTVTLPSTDTDTKVQKSDKKTSYEGIFGMIKELRNQSEGSVFDFQAKSTEIVKIKSEKLLAYHLVLKLLKDNKIDNSIADFFLKTDNIQQSLNDIIFLQKYSKTSIQESDIPSQETLIPYQELIEAKNYDKLITTLENLEAVVPAAFRKNQSTTQQLHTRFTRHSNFSYLKEQFIEDKDDKFRSHVTKVANIFNLEPELIQAAILGEQIRWFFTYRGVAKQLLKDKLQIMHMGQGSYGIWGIKLDTAIDTEIRVQTNYPEVWRQYFTYPNTEKDIKQARQARLESSQTHFFQILYVWAILKEILQTREDAGYDISKQPWVILTLYNIGNKKPHDNPDVGGSLIEIEWQEYSFGALAMLMYYQLKIY